MKLEQISMDSSFDDAQCNHNNNDGIAADAAAVRKRKSIRCQRNK